MDKKANKFLVFGALIIVVLISSFFIFDTGGSNQSPQEIEDSIEQEVIEEEPKIEIFSYQGKEGISALDLLKEKAEVEERNGFVTSINGREADDGANEFWAFYVNSKPAEVGAGEYITEEKDLIEWKIEVYDL